MGQRTDQVLRGVAVALLGLVAAPLCAGAPEVALGGSFPVVHDGSTVPAGKNVRLGLLLSMPGHEWLGVRPRVEAEWAARDYTNAGQRFRFESKTWGGGLDLCLTAGWFTFYGGASHLAIETSYTGIYQQTASGTRTAYEGGVECLPIRSGAFRMGLGGRYRKLQEKADQVVAYDSKGAYVVLRF